MPKDALLHSKRQMRGGHPRGAVATTRLGAIPGGRSMRRIPSLAVDITTSSSVGKT
jgi:hypothetical protein